MPWIGIHRATGVEEVEEEEIERGSVPEDHGRAERVQRAPLVFRYRHEHLDDSIGDRLVERRGERLHLLRTPDLIRSEERRIIC